MLIFENIQTKGERSLLKIPGAKRAKVAGGWFVLITQGAVRGSFFYPDPEHLWGGSSLIVETSEPSTKQFMISSEPSTKLFMIFLVGSIAIAACYYFYLT